MKTAEFSRICSFLKIANHKKRGHGALALDIVKNVVP